MSEIGVSIEHITPLWVCSDAIRQCYDSGKLSDTKFADRVKRTNCNSKNSDYSSQSWSPSDKIIGPKDKSLIDRIGNKMKHESVKNHINFTMSIENITTKTLLALTRHDIGTEFSVESTRFTCKKNKMSYTLTKDEEINEVLVRHMQDILDLRAKGKKCDDLAMLLPQSYQYNLRATMSLTAIQHFLKLRLKPDAHWDIRDLAEVMYREIPEDYKYLFTDSLYNEDKVTVTMTKAQHKTYLESLNG